MITRFLFVVAFVFTSIAHATEQKSPQIIVEDTATEILAALNRDKEEIKKNPYKINEVIDELILPVCDVKRMSKLILSKHWKSATQVQRTQFVKEFKHMLIRSYGEYLVEHSDAEVKVLKASGKNKKYQTVQTELHLKDRTEPLKVAYVFRVADNTSKIIDVKFEGISILKSFRTAFGYEIMLTSLDQLITRIANSNSPSYAMN